MKNSLVSWLVGRPSAVRLCAAALVVIFAAFSLQAADPTIAVTATPRYPWSGMVDLAFTITGDSDTKYDTSVLPATVQHSTFNLQPESYRFLWDANKVDER